MATRKIDFVQGEYYHIYNRGNSKQKIFLDDKDRERFIKLLYICNSKGRIDFYNDITKRKIDVWDFDKGESIVAIGAWVLMPNHFHVYITPLDVSRNQKSKTNKKNALRSSKEEENNISYFFHRVLTAYSKYFNTKYQRTGSLFEDKFKSVHVGKDTQAKYLFAYIHLNPLKLVDSKWKENGIKDKKKAVNFLNSYKWSSYLDYVDIIRPENKVLNRINFLNYFETRKDFENEIFEWMSVKPEEEV